MFHVLGAHMVYTQLPVLLVLVGLVELVVALVLLVALAGTLPVGG